MVAPDQKYRSARRRSRWECRSCRLDFRTFGRLTTHMRRHHGK